MKNSWIILSLIGLVLLGVSACKDDDNGPSDTEIARALLLRQIEEIKSHLEQNNITAIMDPDTETSYGIFREVVEANPQGELVLEGYVALVNYKISRLDGTLIGASQAGQPEWVSYSPSKVNYFPLALRHGLKNVRVGETHRYYVPSQYGYRGYSDGERYQENSIIILEYEIVDVIRNWQEVNALDNEKIEAFVAAENLVPQVFDSGLRKVVLSAGTGAAPAATDSVWVKYKGYLLNKEVFDESSTGDFKVKLGVGGVVAGFEEAIKSMKIGEKSLFILPSAIAYRNDGFYIAPRADLQAFREKGAVTLRSSIPPFSPLVFEIELVRIKAN